MDVLPRPRRSAREIAAELKRLSISDDNRDRLALIHEVQVYQEELIVQNEELRRAQTTLEETRDRFIELYDFAPNGYLTIDPDGMILQLNLTAAAMLGRRRERVEGLPLLGFVQQNDRFLLLDFLRRCRSHESDQGVSVDVTLKGAGRVGAVQLWCKRERPISGPGREYFTAMIDITAQKALTEELRKSAREYAALASRLISIQEEERQRIARDLHDNIGQQLTGLRLKLSRIELSGDDEVRPRVREIDQLVDQLDRQLDFIARELRPAALDLEVGAAIEQFVREWSDMFGIPVDFHAGDSGNLRLPEPFGTHVYRVAQEALNNIYKHAHATRVSVILERTARELLLIVEDDGEGFDQSEAAPPNGMGLLGMRERASIVGGSLQIESAPGSGTTIYFRVANSSAAT